MTSARPATDRERGGVTIAIPVIVCPLTKEDCTPMTCGCSPVPGRHWAYWQAVRKKRQ